MAMEHPSCKERLQLPLTALRSIVVLQRDEAASPFPKGQESRTGRLELKGMLLGGEEEPLWFKDGLSDTRLMGCLVEGRNEAGKSCLVWQPAFSTTAAAMKPGVSGRVVYRDPPPPPSSRPKPQPQQPAGFANAFVKTLASAPKAVAPANAQRVLHLRSGDTIPCDVTRIDESGITFRTAISDATSVAHDRVKAVDFVAGLSFPRLDETKRDRLLTLPRMQRDTPPTHLIRSRSGDFLRGRVVSLDDTMLRVEIRLDEKNIPRDRIAQLIWLHADELEAEPAEASAADAPPGIRVQALQSDGMRLTFFASEVTGQDVSGKSEVLGVCRANVKSIDQLLIGSAIDQAAAELAYNQWKLHRAIEPRIATDDGGSPGVESDLVGQPAPDFTLPLLEGGKFHLAEGGARLWCSTSGPRGAVRACNPCRWSKRS